MNNFLLYIRKMDVFSVPFTPSLNLKTKAILYSSTIGGLFTLTIFSFALFYGIGLIQQWIQYEMPFKISTQEKQYLEDIFVNYFDQSNYTDKFIINIMWNNDEIFEFFASDSIVLIPLLHDVISGETFNLLEYYTISTQNISLEIKNLNNQDYIFYLVSCLENKQYLNNNQNCASQEKFDYYIQLAGLEVDLDVQMSKLNLVTNQIQQTNVYTECFIQDKFSTFKLVNLQYSFYEIISGFFQEKKSQYMLTTDFSVRDQMGTIEYITNYNQYYDPNLQNVRAAIYLTSHQLINQVIIQYPTIGEVLANIGSITQMMLLIGFLLRFINTKWMISEFKYEFKKQFFPQIFMVVEKKIGKSIQYYLDDKQINQISFKEFLKTIDDKIDEKMNYQNLLYEVSRIQIVLEDITTQYKILQSHIRQFKFDLIYDKNNGEYHIFNYWDQNRLIELQPRNTLAPFALNISMQRQSEQFCKNLSADRELVSPQTEMLYNHHYHDQ